MMEQDGKERKNKKKKQGEIVMNDPRRVQTKFKQLSSKDYFSKHYHTLTTPISVQTW